VPDLLSKLAEHATLPPIVTPPPDDTSRTAKKRRTMEDGEISDREGDVPMTPRTVVPLPQAMRAHFVWPDAEESYTGEPPSDNIHYQTSQRDGAAPAPSAITEPYTDAIFPRAVFERKDLLKNLDQRQVDFIAKSDAALAIVPFGAGQKFHADNPKWGKEVEKFLKSLGFSGGAKLSVAPPTPRNRPDLKKAFAQPWAYILSGAPEELNSYLVGFQTFAVRPSLTFHVVPFDEAVQSWFVMVVRSNSVESTIESAHRTVGVIKRTIFKSEAIKNLINQLYAMQQVVGTKEERVLRYTDSFHLMFVKTKSENQDPEGDPVFVLTARPFDKAEHTAEIRKILSPTSPFYFDDTSGTYLEINKTHVNCALCKQSLHPAHACTYTLTDGWTGTKPDARANKPVTGRNTGKKNPGASDGAGWQRVQKKTRR